MTAATDARLAEWLEEAANRGREAGMAAASWVTDGNTPVGHYAKLAQMFDEGDPELWDFLPEQPNLSGEFADGLTPKSLFEDITGQEHMEAEQNAGLAYETLVGSVMDAIADAWEAACDEAFAHECERLVRGAVA